MEYENADRLVKSKQAEHQSLLVSTAQFKPKKKPLYSKLLGGAVFKMFYGVI